MDPTAVTVAISAAASALTSMVITILNFSLVRVTRESVNGMSEQTREVMNARMDARAPRVIVREPTVWPSPMVALRSGGRSMRPVGDAELNELADAGHMNKLFSLVVSWKVANEGAVTARIELPDGAELGGEENPTVSRYFFLAPGNVQAVVANTEATLGEWLQAAQSRIPIGEAFPLLIGDGFGDGVRDLVTIAVKGYLVVRGREENSPLSGAIEARLAQELETDIDIDLISREYAPRLEIEARVKP